MTPDVWWQLIVHDGGRIAVVRTSSPRKATVPVTVSAALGLLYRFWDAIGTHGDHGELWGVTPRELADLVGWRLDPPILLNALIDGGYLDARDLDDELVNDRVDVPPDALLRFQAKGWREIGGRLERKRDAPNEYTGYVEPKEPLIRRRDIKLKVPRRFADTIYVRRFTDQFNAGRPRTHALSVAEAIGTIIQFWGIVADGGIDGRLDGVVPDDLARRVGLGRRAGRDLISALDFAELARSGSGFNYFTDPFGFTHCAPGYRSMYDDRDWSKPLTVQALHWDFVFPLKDRQPHGQRKAS